MEPTKATTMRRRDFLATSAAALSAALPATASNNNEWRNKQSGMTYRRLGRTGFMVSSVGMGGDDIRPDNYDQVLYAMDLGLNYLDTSPRYGGGLSEKGYAEVLKARGRENVFLTSKTYHVSTRDWEPYDALFESLPESEQTKYRNRVREEVERTQATKHEYMGHYFNGQDKMIRKSVLWELLVKDFSHKVEPKKDYKKLILANVEESLTNLGTDYLDCLLCPHGADIPFEATGIPEIYEAFELLKKQGKVRHLGFSAHSDPARILDAVIDSGVFSMCLIAYNFSNHEFVDGVLEKAAKADFGVLAMKASRVLQNPFNRRRLVRSRVQALDKLVPDPDLTPFQKGFKWALAQPNLNGVVMGISDMEMAKQDVPLALENAG